jgi:hypothetical protein
MQAFIDPNFFSTKTQDFITITLIFIFARNAGFVAAQDFAFAKLLILPEFAFAGRAFDRQHQARNAIS